MSQRINREERSGSGNERCPACGKDTLATAFRARPYGGAARVAYTMLACRRCRFMRAVGPLDDALLRETYGAAFHESAQRSAPAEDLDEVDSAKLRYPILINAVERAEYLRSLRSGGKLLDIGAGRGYFVKVASQSFDAQGIDLSPEAAAYACRVGANVKAGDFLSAIFDNGPFDVVTLWDVFSCLPEPGPAMRKLSSLVAPGGHLVMTVPDSGSLAARSLRRFWPLLIPPININYYSRASLAALLAQHGFRLVHSRHVPKAVSIDFIVRKLAMTAGLERLAKLPLPVKPSWRIRLNTWDILTVVAVRETTA